MRGKRQDPSSRANDRHSTMMAVPTLEKPGMEGRRTQRRFSSGVRKRVPQAPGRRAKKSHPKSRRWRHRRPAPPRGRIGRRASSQCRRGVGELAAETHSTGGFGRPMSVNRGKRMWRIPTPHLSCQSPQGRRGKDGPQGPASGPPAGNCRGAFLRAVKPRPPWNFHRGFSALTAHSVASAVCGQAAREKRERRCSAACSSARRELTG